MMQVSLLKAGGDGSHIDPECLVREAGMTA